MRYTTALAGFTLVQLALAQDIQLKPVQVKYMMRGYFHASSKGPAELNGFGGWGGSDNAATRFTPPAAAPSLQILVDTLNIVPLDSLYEGRKVTVRNNGSDTLFFAARDSRLCMKTQAMRSDSFADIEYLPSSWCGNSYHTLFLAPGEQWHFVMPKYDGPEPTRLRLELAYGSTAQEDGKKLAYSHTFPGAVHRKQFSEKRDYHPRGMMDPYND